MMIGVEHHLQSLIMHVFREYGIMSVSFGEQARTFIRLMKPVTVVVFPDVPGYKNGTHFLVSLGSDEVPEGTAFVLVHREPREETRPMVSRFADRTTFFSANAPEMPQTLIGHLLDKLAVPAAKSRSV
jgi:hypothetical protein